MRALTISNRKEMIFALQDEVRRSPDARYDHRLHGVLLVAQGMSCRKAAEALGDSPRMVAYWVRRFERTGFAGLSDGEREGRPSRLSEKQRGKVEAALRCSPADFGLQAQLWDGPLLSAFLQKQLGVTLRVRQCQRLFRQLGFRLRKRRHLIAQADQRLPAAHKKTSSARPQSPRGRLGGG
jgi:transposase